MQKEELSCIKQHPYSVSFGETNLGPLAEPPRIQIETKINESYIYETNGEEAVLQKLANFRAKISLKTKNIEVALILIESFSRGNYINMPENQKALIFTPVCENKDEKQLIFPVTVLMPDMRYEPTMINDHIITLYFFSYADSKGKLFTFREH